jgi:hypothetical protein
MQAFAAPPGEVAWGDDTVSLFSGDFSPNTVNLRIFLRPTGLIELRRDAFTFGTIITDDWNTWFDSAPVGPVDPLSDWEVRFQFSSGTDTFYAAGSNLVLNTWTPLLDSTGMRIAWQKSTGISLDIGTYTLEIRDTATMTLIDTMTITANLNRDAA